MNTIIITVISIIILVLPFIFYSRWSNLYGKSDFDDIVFNNDKIYVFSNIYHSGGDGDAYRDCRISEIDKKSGSITRRLSTMSYSKLNFVGIIKGKIWLKDERFCVLDPEVFKIVFEQKKIGELFQELKNVEIKELYLNEVEKTVHILAENGYKYSINPDNFEITRKDFFQDERIIRMKEKSKFNTKFGFKKLKATERCEITYENITIGNDLSFINPEFLRATSTNRIVGFETPECVAIMHYDTLNKLAMFRISLVSFTGEILWTVNQEDLDVRHNIGSEFAARLDYVNYQEPDLVLVFKAKRDEIVCIDTAKGVVLWNIKL